MIKQKTNPIFEGMKEELKDLKNFELVEKKLFKLMRSDHKHETVKQYVKCERCYKKLQARKIAIREMGFKSYEQYASWKKVMVYIISNIKANEENNKKPSDKSTKGKQGTQRNKVK
jgi:hypothetical protein